MLLFWEYALIDNTELQKALELDLKIHFYPEFLYHETENKTRVVIAGSHGKTTITPMIMHVLRYHGYKFDYMEGCRVEGFDNMVSLSMRPWSGSTAPWPRPPPKSEINEIRIIKKEHQPMTTHNSSSSSSMGRREFMKTVSAAGLGLAVAGSPALAQTESASIAQTPKVCHRGHRLQARHVPRAIVRDYKDHAELVALCDLNPGRVELSRQRAAAAGVQVPGYAAADFEKMIRETRPDTVIVTTVDATHDDYIVRAMEAGCDVITEKPMTTTPEKCQRILDARKRTGRRIRVTFNYRYSPPRTQVKDLLMTGAIGDVLSVDFHWLLNTMHGADYFRRWHRQKKNSGGLMVHKATHHFDLVNWWLAAVPADGHGRGQARVLHARPWPSAWACKARTSAATPARRRTSARFLLDLAANAGAQGAVPGPGEARRLLPRPLRLQRRRSTSRTP